MNPLRSSSRRFALLLVLAVASGCATGVTDGSGVDVSATTPAAADSTDDGGALLGDDTGANPDSGSSEDGSSPGAGNQNDGASQTSPDAGGADAAGGDLGSDAASGSNDAGSVAALPTQGEVLITEVMFNPSGTEPDDEWIEVTTTTDAPRTITGLTIVDGSARTHVIQNGPDGKPIQLQKGQFMVLARSITAVIAAHVPATAVGYEYGTGLPATSGIQLANGATGAVSLKSGGSLIAQANYGGWFTAEGASIQMMTPYAFASGAEKSQFCESKHPFVGVAGADLGTPGAASDCGN